LRAASKPLQPERHEVNASAGRWDWTPVMKVPVCWFAYPLF
jgi:hypothetical protein